MRRDFTTIFHNEQVGFYSLGPDSRIVFSIVTYRNKDNRLCWYGDVRFNSYAVKSNKYNPSQKGITLSPDSLLKIYNCINQMPITADIPGEDFRVLVLPKNKWKEIQVHILHYDGRIWVDIRDYATQSYDGYTGRLTSGVRVDYTVKDHFGELLYKIYEKMVGLTEQYGTDCHGNKIAGVVDKLIK